MPGYVLLQVQSGAAESIARHLESEPEIEVASVVHGPYDVIAHVAPAAGMDQALRLCSRIAGTLRVLPCHSRGPAGARAPRSSPSDLVPEPAGSA